ncbi:pentatricopeptide repeat-containing family protein [Hibiscus syriacus]|uniref:Pentatricopeptide repeat-containing family protein n=1 Tax=Hibiscus syriacus TaxID=106335 RepID=A0A6A3CGP3_HIBSY|nr:pentatricopeptide repeat-containing family protein [Hibiscus syriacus]
MVVKMMRWRPWPPLVSKKYEVKLIVRRLEGWDLVGEGWEKLEKVKVEVRWKGPKASLSSLRRTVKRNFTKEVDGVDENGVVVWDEEFQTLCNLSAYKDSAFHPWEIAFSALNGLSQGSKNKVPVVGTASLNLAEYALAAEQKEFELNIPLVLSTGAVEPGPQLRILLSLLELRTTQETYQSVERALMLVASPVGSGETVAMEKDEISAIKAGLRKVKFFKEYVSARGAKKACREDEGSEGRCSARSDDGEYPLDTDSLDGSEEGESDEVTEDSAVRKSFSYGTLADTKYAGRSIYSSMRISEGDEDWVYYSNRKSDVGCSNVEDSVTPVSEPSLLRSSKRSILSWRKRKLSFMSPKAKGEPLLKKGYGEEGGDDIDFDRRQVSSDESHAPGSYKGYKDSSTNRTSASEFGDDNFAIGNWEQKEVRSERAAGESACTALVAVIADWLQNNRDMMPIKSQFDSLIREGSLEWRNLCENESYRERFPDKHFDLETVLQAKVRPLSVVPRKSFIGFFHPEGMDEGRFDFLHGAMSFDNIWDEISRAGSECPNSDQPEVYIVSWNDHFFILKVEPEAYYIIDTLGERLYEGCNQAYILKFDCNTVIHKLPNEAQSSDDKSIGDQQIAAAITEPNNLEVKQANGKEGSVAGAVVIKPEKSIKSEDSEGVVFQGKESCKEYIKSFLAAIPIRELQADIKKGLMASTPLHHRLQIEFHYTEFLQPLPETCVSPMTTATKMTPSAPHMVEVPVN